MKNTGLTRIRCVEIMFFLSGLLLLATGINLLITVPHFGLSPWDSFFIALRDNFGFTIGFWMFVLNAFFLLMVLVLKRNYVSLSTVAIVILISVFVDTIQVWFASYLMQVPDVVAFVLGAVLVGYGIGIYVSAALGVAPQEGFMLSVSEKTGWSYRRTEITASLFVLLASFLLDGPIHYGTIILTIAVGLIIQLSMGQAKRLLTKINTPKKGEM